ncbi:peptidase family M50 [archaeon BMS3Abin16]|nr:peptidase family M50 [archaeon BMS3Abin16]
MKEGFDLKGIDDPKLLEIVSKAFTVETMDTDSATLFVKPRFSDETSFNIVLDELTKIGLYPLYREENGRLTLRITGKKGNRRELNPVLHLVLLLATIFTVTVAGYIWWAGGDFEKSVYFTIGLMGILGSHELGHALVARRNKVDATLPFFLPVPPFFAFGTLGAVIFMNSPIPDRKSLFDIGIAGPLTGFVLSLPVLVLGIARSTYIPFNPTVEASPFLLGTPLLFNAISRMILGPELPGQILQTHPIAIAGWAGLFVTSLNLLPMGQLDGGHVIRSVVPKNFKKIYRIVFKLLFTMGAAGILAQIYSLKWLADLTWPGWIFWAALVYFMTKLDHPGPLNDVTPLDPARKAVSVLILIIFLVSFTPVPIMSL